MNIKLSKLIIKSSEKEAVNQAKRKKSVFGALAVPHSLKQLIEKAK
ncbi:hypothetical protein [Paenibacillus agilis]|nr:hypothetical protein [Paenibacillus agilis]